MIETNIRIVRPGKNLYVLVRKAIVSGSDSSVDLMERACNALRYQKRLAAVPVPGEVGSLYVASLDPIENIHLEDEAWELDVQDSNNNPIRLVLSDSVGQKLIPLLIERTLLAELSKRKDMWTLDSPRIFYEMKPFKVEMGIAAYRRYEVSTILVDDVGVGIVVDVGTAFFTEKNLAYFFSSEVDDGERKRREDWFTQLTGRQEGQKGTLLYDTGLHRSKCYFEAAPIGLTCSTTGKLRVKGESYDSLLTYYQKKYPHLVFDPTSPAVRVSFHGIERPQPVAAERVTVRVMNENVPEILSSVDKIAPNERRQLINAFWSRLGYKALGNVAPSLLPGFWRPDSGHLTNLPIPELHFGKTQKLSSPIELNPQSFKNHYRQRIKYLDENGCYSIPPAMTREVIIAHPSHLNNAIPQQFAKDMINQLSKWTGVRLTSKLIPYANVVDAVEKMKGLGSGGVAIFVLDNEPVAYYEVTFQLPAWRIKRITDGTLGEKYQNLERGIWDRSRNSYNHEKGRGSWDSFIDMNSLALLYLLETVPFRSEGLGVYEGQLIIDVGHQRNFFGLSLLVNRSDNETPSFLLRSDVHRKDDVNHETINPVILGDQICNIFKNGFPRNFEPLKSLLILRDGALYPKEQEGVQKALRILTDTGYLLPDARVDLVDLNKDSLKSIRVWEVSPNENAFNALEGHLIQVNRTISVLLTTGAATLHQGTAEPIILRANGASPKLIDASSSVFTSAQMNWFSPGVAQRLPLAQKVVDDELQARSAQEIRRLR